MSFTWMVVRLSFNQSAGKLFTLKRCVYTVKLQGLDLPDSRSLGLGMQVNCWQDYFS